MRSPKALVLLSWSCILLLSFDGVNGSGSRYALENVRAYRLIAEPMMQKGRTLRDEPSVITHLLVEPGKPERVIMSTNAVARVTCSCWWNPWQGGDMSR